MLDVVSDRPVCPGPYCADSTSLYRALHCAALATAAMTVSCVPALCLYCEDLSVISSGLSPLTGLPSFREVLLGPLKDTDPVSDVEPLTCALLVSSCPPGLRRSHSPSS